MLKSWLVSLQNMSITALIPSSDWLKSTSGYWVTQSIFQRLVLLTRRKKGNIMLPAVCLLSAVWPNTPTKQPTLYQRPDCWRQFLVLLFIEVIKPPGIYFNNWLQLSCRSSKFSSSFPATSVLLYAPLDPIRELAKCFNYFSDKHYMQVATSSTFPSANDVIDLCWILYNKSLIVATFFFQRTTAFELFFYSTYLHFRFLVLGKQKLNISVSRPDLFDSWSFTCSCFIFAYIISRRNGENNGLLAGVSFPPSSRPPALAFLSRLTLPFPSFSKACHAG